MSDRTNCPSCSTDLRDRPIPQEKRHLYGGQAYFMRTIGMIIPGVYDGVLLWLCPDCGFAWHRWTDDDMKAKAQQYIDDHNESIKEKVDSNGHPIP